MELHELEKQKMDTVKALAEMSMQVSQARNLLTKLESEETEYLDIRERKALDRIAKVLADSQELLEQTSKNYAEIENFGHVVSDFAAQVAIAYDQFQSLISDFDERSEEWDKTIKDREKEITEQKKALEIQRVILQNDQKTIEMKKKALANEAKKIEDRRATLARAIKRLKENKI